MHSVETPIITGLAELDTIAWYAAHFTHVSQPARQCSISYHHPLLMTDSKYLDHLAVLLAGTSGMPLGGTHSISLGVTALHEPMSDLCFLCNQSAQIGPWLSSGGKKGWLKPGFIWRQ